MEESSGFLQILGEHRRFLCDVLPDIGDSNISAHKTVLMTEIVFRKI
jgi:hypothetical protein